ncbi:hypothetical protein RCH09_003426 [Actimicrobium sp. GrIS 1.19]|uniref:hypothetical protein n=1 Tax=Actimicrobium sp. GrIS 1.19 TaxID=3071708 RepID=UPI002E0B1EBB|nr:hypothetical protein [Actimicrobium sp. GrIS 1.19]
MQRKKRILFLLLVGLIVYLAVNDLTGQHQPPRPAPGTNPAIDRIGAAQLFDVALRLAGATSKPATADPATPSASANRPASVPVPVAVPVIAAAPLLDSPPAPRAPTVRSAPARESIRIAPTAVSDHEDKDIPLLGPVGRSSRRDDPLVAPYMLCTIEVWEHGIRVSHQTVGCARSDRGDRQTMLMEFGQEVPNEIPNMKYWLSVQVDGYRADYPVLRTRMDIKGLLGRSPGRRTYESLTLVKPDRKQTLLSFAVDDDDFAVLILAHGQRGSVAPPP